MREILFRGKQKEGCWIQGFYWKDIWGDGDSCYINFDNDDYPVIPESVGQFTGLYDKNNVHIFEGDITYYDFGINVPVLMKVVFNEGEFRLMPIDQYDFNVWEIRICNEEKTIEVIGNIHDNPELLSKH